jgi:Family of unknown function (DUF6401)
MTRQLDDSAPGSDLRLAHAALATLGDVIGSGLAAARRQPRLLSLLDEHAAAVRDSLRGDLVPLSAVALARYAQGVRDAARDHGWHLPDAPVDWTTNAWLQTRLLAVYALARGGWPALG